MASLLQHSQAQSPSSGADTPSVNSGASDPFGQDPSIDASPSMKVDRIRTYVCLQSLLSPQAKATARIGEEEQQAQICIDLVVRTKSPSPSAFRFRSGWLSHSTVAGVKKIIFEGVTEILNGTKVESNSKTQKVMGFTTVKGKEWRNITDLDPVGEKKGSSAAASGVVSSLKFPLSTPKSPITSDCKLAITFVPTPGIPIEKLIEHTRQVFEVKGGEYYFFQVMLDRMAIAREDEEGRFSSIAGEDELVKDKMRKAASALSSGGSDSDEIEDAESTNLSLRETLRQRATNQGGFRASSFSFDDAENSDEDNEDEIMWLDDELQSMKVLFPYETGDTFFKPNASKSKEQMLSESCLNTPIIFKIIPAYKLPPPVLRIRIPYTQQTVDIFQKRHTVYHMFLKQGRLSWRVVKRYSDFVKLVEHLTTNSAGVADKIPMSSLPALPPKALPVASVSMSSKLVARRRDGLEKFSRALAKLPSAMSNVTVLSFLGIVNSARQDEEKLKKKDKKAENRNVIHVSQLRGMLKWGDLILFRCANPVSATQRLATGAEWDHVALVVKRRGGRNLELLESTGDGVQCYNLISRLKAYGSEFTERMAVRSLIHTRTFQEYENMLDFIDKVEGMDYGFNLGKLLGALTINKRIGIGEGGKDGGKEETDDKEGSMSSYKSLGTRRSSNATTATMKEDRGGKAKGGGMGGIAGVGTLLDFSNKKESYFCSELIAAALKAMGLMFERRNELFFWPGEFGRGGALEKSLKKGCGYGEEILIDCRLMEIGSARISPGGFEEDLGEDEEED